MSNKQNKNSKEKKGYHWAAISSICSFFALLISLTVFFSGYGENGIFPHRKVEVLPQCGFYILREFNTCGSDSLLLPIDWDVKGNRISSVQNVYLIVNDLSEDEPKSYRFNMDGEFENLPYGNFSDLKLGNIINLETKIITKKNLLFRIENWWEDSTFHFSGDGYYNVTLYYEYNNEKTDSKYLFHIDKWASISSLAQLGEENQLYTLKSWDYYSLNDFSRSAEYAER